jgi:lysophospholipase L1-like esterase
MEAMNGSGRRGVRRYGRLLGCMAALLALAAMTLPSAAVAMKAPKVKKTYVALGDSLAFGYSKEQFNHNEATAENPTGFEHGYANDYFGMINKGGHWQLVDDGCPGETTEALIGDNPALLGELNAALAGKIPEPVTGEAPCAYHTVDHFPLHNEYGEREVEPGKFVPRSQLESVLETIAVDGAAGKPVKLITIDVGADDQLHQIAKIEAEVKATITRYVTEEVEAITKTIVFDKIKAIAEKEVESYVIEQVGPQAYGESNGGEEPAFREDVGKDAAAYSASHAGELAAKVGEDIEIYSATHAAELAKEGEVIGGEQLAKFEAEHGAELAARGNREADEKIASTAGEVGKQIITNITGIFTAIKGAGFKGRLILEGTYDAYGNDREEGEPEFGHELLPGSNELVAALAAEEKKTFKKGTLKACYSDPQLLFNTQNAEEPVHMKEWTNMDNFTTFEGKANGPDIHATPLGYEVMAAQIDSTCGS